MNKNILLLIFLGMFLLVSIGSLSAIVVHSNATVSYYVDGSINYTILIYKGGQVGTFNFTDNAFNVSVLVVGGGGSGGEGQAGVSVGGGGASGVVRYNSTILTPANYNIIVGSGGIGGGDSFSPSNGTASIFEYFNGTDLIEAKGGHAPVDVSRMGGNNTDHKGGYLGTSFNNGGGAGSFADGILDEGGNGTIVNINGTSTCFAGGGGGYDGGVSPGACGGGNGGNGGAGGNASANTGGGGGGGDGDKRGYGASGIVIIRFARVLEIATTLNSPLNNSNVTSGNLTFNSTISPTYYSLTNATLNIWFVNGSLTSKTTNTSFIGNISIITKDVSTIGSYYWNVEGCEGNGAGANCSFSTSNYTLNVKKLMFGNQIYETQVIEGSSTTFRQNISIGSDYAFSAINLTYNFTNYSASIFAYNLTFYQVTVSLNTPFVIVNSNKTFNWTVLLTDNSLHYSANYNQTVLNFGLDNCVVNTVQILNLTLVDEDSQSSLNATGDNTSIKVDLNLYSDPSLSSPTFQFFKLYNETLPARVCINSTLGSTTFYMNAQIEYGASDYATEFYNIQNYSLNASSNPSENLTLYDILTSRSQVFLIKYKDSRFLPVQDALIQISRKYVDEGVFKTVEVPVTDSNGQTVSNLVLNSVVYTFTVTKNGELLAVFSNYLAKCQNPLITTCEIDLNEPVSGIINTNYTSAQDFLYTLTYDNNTRTVSSTFVIPSGASSLVSLNVTSTDALSTELCSQSVTTSSGSLSCVVPLNFGNGTVTAKLYKNNVQVAVGQLNLQQTPEQIYGGFVILLGVLIFLSLMGASMSDNPIYMVVFLLVGVFLLISLNLVASNGFIGAGATVLFLVIGIIILLIKGGSRT